MGEKAFVELNQTMSDGGEPTALVRDSGREKALKKIELFAQQNKKGILEETIDKRNNLWAKYFLELAQRFFTITPRQMRELDDDDLKYIDEITAKMAQKWHRITQAYFCMPIIGWFGYIVAHCNEANNRYGEALKSWHYIRERERVKRQFEKKYFPVHVVRERLKNRQ